MTTRELQERLSHFKSSQEKNLGEESLDLSGVCLGESSENVSYLVSWLMQMDDAILLTELNLSNCQLSDTALQNLYRVIVTKPNLRYLDLSFNQMGIVGAYGLLDVLRRSKYVESVSIFGNPFFTDSSIKSKHALEELISHFDQSPTWQSCCGCKTLKPTLYYAPSPKFSQPAVDAEVELIGAELRKNSDLKDLAVDLSKFSRSAILKLFFSLGMNSTLLSLTLYNLRSSMLDSSLLREDTTSKIFPISHSKLKTLRINFVECNETVYPQVAESLRWFKDNLLATSNLTTLHLDNLPSTDDSPWFDEVRILLDTNRSIIHLGFLRCRIEEPSISSLITSLSKNESIRLVQLDEDSKSSIEIFHSKIKDIVLMRATPLLIRLGNSKEISFKDINGRQCGTEWQVSDQVEALVDDDRWSRCRIISISEDLKYGVCFASGKVYTNVRTPSLRKPDGFLRDISIALVGDRIPVQVGEMTISTGYETNREFRNILNRPSPYFIGQKVYGRVYGDSEWYNCTVLKVARCDRSLTENKESGEYYLLDLEFEDGLMISEVEEHFVSIAKMKDSSSNYDTGVYQRGDYVEMYKVMSNDGLIWRRGRIAIDKKNGSYDLRFENGQDEFNVRGKYLRHHFRSKDKVDIRILGCNQWVKGHIVAAEKNGTYQVAYESDASNHWSNLLASNKNILVNAIPVVESSVVAKRLMPQGRQSARDKSKHVAAFIFHQVTSAYPGSIPTVHSIDLTDENFIVKAPTYDSLRSLGKEDNKIITSRVAHYPTLNTSTLPTTKVMNKDGAGSILKRFEQMNMDSNRDNDSNRFLAGSRVYIFDDKTNCYDLFLIESINPDLTLNVRNVKGNILFDVSAERVIGEADYLRENSLQINTDMLESTNDGYSVFKIGARVECRLDGSNGWFPAVVARRIGNGMYAVILDQEDHEREILCREIRVMGSSISQRHSPFPITDTSTPPPQRSLPTNNKLSHSGNYSDPGLHDLPGNFPSMVVSQVDYNILNHIEQLPLIGKQESEGSPLRPEDGRRYVSPVLREGTRVEYMPPNCSIVFQGCIQKLDHYKGLCEILLDDGSVVEGVDSSKVNPITKSLMRSPKQSYLNGYNGSGEHKFSNSNDLYAGIGPTTPTLVGKVDSSSDTKPSVATSTIGLSSPAPPPSRPPTSLRSTTSSPRAGMMISRVSTFPTLQNDALDTTKSRHALLSPNDDQHPSLVHIGLYYNFANFVHSPTQSNSCPFFFYMTINQPKMNDSFHFVLEIILPSVFSLSSSHRVVGHFSEQMVLRDHYFIDIQPLDLSVGTKQVLVPMFLSLHGDQVMTNADSSSASDNTPFVTRIEQDPPLVQLFLYHQCALVGCLECFLSVNSEVMNGVTKVLGFNNVAILQNNLGCCIASPSLYDIGILDASVTPLYHTASYVQFHTMNPINNAVASGSNRLMPLLVKSTNEFNRNFQYSSQVISLAQLSSHHLSSIVSKKVVSVMLFIDDFVSKFPSMERLFDHYPLLFNVINGTLSSQGQLVVFSIVIPQIMTTHQGRSLNSFLQSMNQSCPWPRNRVAISLVALPKPSFADMSQYLHLPYQRNATKSYWKNQQSMQVQQTIGDTNAIVDRQVKLLNITQNLQALSHCSEGILPSFFLLMPFDNGSVTAPIIINSDENGSSAIRDRSRMVQLNVPLLEFREYLFNVLISMSKNGKSIWYLNTSGDEFFSPSNCCLNSGGGNINSNILEDKAPIWAKPLRLELTWTDLLIFSPVVKLSILSMIVQRLLLADSNIDVTQAPLSSCGLSSLTNLVLNKMLPCHVNDIHVESLASYLVLFEFFDIIEDTFHRCQFSLLNQPAMFVEGQEQNREANPIGSSSAKFPSGSNVPVHEWHSIAHEITQQMLQNHDLFSYSFSGSSSFHGSTASVKSTGSQRESGRYPQVPQPNAWIVNYIVSNTILICERQFTQYNFFCSTTFIEVCHAVRMLLDGIGDPSIFHGSLDPLPSLHNKSTAGTTTYNATPVIINWLREAGLFCVTLVERESKGILYRRFLTSHIYDKHFRDWVHTLRQLKTTHLPVVDTSIRDGLTLGFTVVERNSNEREITIEISFKQLTILNSAHYKSGFASMDLATTKASGRALDDEICSHLVGAVGIVDPAQVSFTRDMLVNQGCSTWKDFLDLMEIIFSTTIISPLTVNTAANPYYDNLRKFLQDELQLPLLLALKLANFYTKYRESNCNN